MLGIAGQIHEMIDNALKLDSKGKKPLYGSKTSCRKLSGAELPSLDCLTLITGIYHAIENVKRREQNPSPMNWSWRTTSDPSPNPKNTNPEICLERELINKPEHKDWTYQIPTSSGLVDAHRDKRRAIDLVHRCKDGWYEFIDLKVDSDTPLFAAMEILQYGLLYMFSRTHRAAWGYTKQQNPLLYANGVHLKVLAPDEYYKNDKTGTRYELGWIEKRLNKGLNDFLKRQDCDFDITFSFESFTNKDHWLKDPAKNRTRVYAVKP